MVEGRGLPGRRVVAGLASLGESAGHVIGIRGALKVLQVARNAGGAGQVVVVVDVAVGALPRRHGMSAGQGEIDHRVIEGGRRPGDRRVALGTRRREIRGNVIWIRRALVILEVTANARCTRQVEAVVRMTIGALPRRNCMASSQWESNGVVIKSGIEPGVCTVAGIASCGEASGHVAWAVSRFEVRGMARVALRGHRLKLAIGSTFVAGSAVDRRVRPSQWKSIVVLLDLLDRYLPAANRVTLLTICPQLPLVNIGMAILAALAHVRKNGLHMALNACDGLMHPA
jgi:hypothetical protein